MTDLDDFLHGCNKLAVDLKALQVRIGRVLDKMFSDNFGRRKVLYDVARLRKDISELGTITMRLYEASCKNSGRKKNNRNN